MRTEREQRGQGGTGAFRLKALGLKRWVAQRRSAMGIVRERAVEGAGESRNGAAGAVWAESLARYPLIVRCRESYCYHCLTGVIDDNNTVDGHIGSIYLFLLGIGFKLCFL